MKITITIKDTETGKCNVEFDFDPGISQEDRGSTPAARLALRILDSMAEEVTAAHVEATDPDES